MLGFSIGLMGGYNVGGGSPSVFSPEDISSLVFAMDARKTATVTTATGVSSWASYDLSGLAAVQADTTKQPAYTSGQFISGDGVNDRLDIADTAAIQLTGSMSITTYCRLDVVAGVSIVSKLSGQRAYQIATDGTGLVYFYIAPTIGTLTERKSAATLTVSVWAHVAVVYNAVAQTMDVYINGALSNGALTGTVPASQFSANGWPLSIFARPDGLGPANASVQNVEMYAKALSPAEIGDLYTYATT